MEFLRNGFITNGVSIKDGKEEIESSRFFPDSRVLAKLIEKIIDRYDDCPKKFYTGDIFRCFRTFRRDSRARHGRGSDEFNNNLEYGG